MQSQPLTLTLTPTLDDESNAISALTLTLTPTLDDESNAISALTLNEL